MSVVKSARYNRLIGTLWQPRTARIRHLRASYSLPEAKLTTTTIAKPISVLQSLISLQTQMSPPQLGVTPAKAALPLPVELTPTPAQSSNLMPLAVKSIPPRNLTPAAARPPQVPAELIKDWEQLTSTIKHCQQCTLCSGRKQVVIERGNRQGPWMFIGEGPGAEDDLQGLPFIGNAGQLLDKMITAMNLDLQRDVYITNVVKCHPTQKRNPDPEEIRACSNYLHSQIQLVKPQIIVTLGRYAAQTLLNKPLALGKLRGSAHDYQGIPLIVTYHPDYLLRTPTAKKEAWDDLQLAMHLTKPR